MFYYEPAGSDVARKACRAVSVERRPVWMWFIYHSRRLRCSHTLHSLSLTTNQLRVPQQRCISQNQETAAMLRSNILINNSFGEIEIWNAVHLLLSEFDEQYCNCRL